MCFFQKQYCRIQWFNHVLNIYLLCASTRLVSVDPMQNQKNIVFAVVKFMASVKKIKKERDNTQILLQLWLNLFSNSKINYFIQEQGKVSHSYLEYPIWKRVEGWDGKHPSGKMLLGCSTHALASLLGPCNLPRCISVWVKLCHNMAFQIDVLNYWKRHTRSTLCHLLMYFTPSYLTSVITDIWASLMAQMVKNLTARQETQVQSLLKGMATPSSILAWRIPWTEESGRLQSVGLQ